MYVDTNKLLILPLVLMYNLAQLAGQVSAQQGTGDQNNGDPNNPNPDPYGNYDMNYNQPDYSNYEQQQPAAPPAVDDAGIQCYSCYYEVTAGGHQQGMTNCQDPFVKLDIPTVGCKGPCGKVYRQHTEHEFTIHRSCIPNCKERRQAQSYTQCCSHGFCNTATSLRPSWISHLVLMTSLYILFIHVRR